MFVSPKASNMSSTPTSSASMYAEVFLTNAQWSGSVGDNMALGDVTGLSALFLVGAPPRGVVHRTSFAAV